MKGHIFGVTLAFFAGCAQQQTGEDDTANKAKESSTESETEGKDGEDPIAAGSISVGLAGLPNVIDPVFVAEESDPQKEEVASFDSQVGTLKVDALALTAVGPGIPLNKEFPVAGISYSACEMANRARGFLASASESDFTGCMLGHVIGDSTKFYDGADHVVEIKGEGGSMKMKFAIEGTVEKVSKLTFFMCEGGQQSGYVRKAVGSDGVFTILAKGSSDPDNPQVSHVDYQTDVVGQLNALNQFIGLKKVTNTYRNQFSAGGGNGVREQVTQSSLNFQIQGISDEGDRSYRYLGMAALADANAESDPYDLQKVYLGDGALATIFANDETIIQGWTGATKALNNSNSYAGRVFASKDLVPAAAAVDDQFAFSSGESWDCDGAPEASLTMEELMKALGATSGKEGDFGDCSRFTLNQNIHLECSTGTNKTSL